MLSLVCSVSNGSTGLATVRSWGVEYKADLADLELEAEDTCGTMALFLWAVGAHSGPRGPGCEVEPRLPAEAPSTRAGLGR